MHSFNLAHYICIDIHIFNHKNFVKSDTTIKSGCMEKVVVWAKQKKKILSMEAH